MRIAQIHYDPYSKVSDKARATPQKERMRHKLRKYIFSLCLSVAFLIALSTPRAVITDDYA